MPVEVKIPELGESITEVVLSKWRKSSGDWVEKDEDLFEIESDKITTDIPAPESGVVETRAEEGAELDVGAVVAVIDTDAGKPEESSKEKKEERAKESRAETKKESKEAEGKDDEEKAADRDSRAATAVEANGEAEDEDVRITSVARKMAKERGIDLAEVKGTGAGGRITKGDILRVTEDQAEDREEDREPATPRPARRRDDERGVRREKMSKLRQRIAERLVYAKNTTAMLTTFNECDMSEVIALRKRYKDSFEEKHGVGLGFISFFVKACCSALEAFPRLNAYLDGDSIEYHDFVDMSIAVSTEKGLTVPILRDADLLTFAEVEEGVRDLATRARERKLMLEDLTGGTFTITNGGIFGSLNSTPILNPPQSGILGMHKIMNRPIEDAENPGQIVLRPMMYIALSYDHRIVDGAEAVQFLVHVKECIEDPQRMLIGI